MRKIMLLIIALVLTSNLINAQSAKFDDIVDFKLVNSGAISDSDNNVDGYYFFYEVDKLKKGDREYAIKILDNNLNAVATKKIVNRKNTFLAASAYNNMEMLFLFINLKDKQYRLVGYDLKGNKSRDTIIDIDKKEIYWLMSLQSTGYGELLTAIDNKGFILSTTVKNKKMGYKVQFLSSSTDYKPWTINSPADASQILSIKPIEANEKYIITLEMSKKSKMSQKSDIAVYVIDANSGKTLFKKPYTKEANPRLITNAFVDTNEIVLLGEFFDSGDNIFKAKSKGLFVEKYDASGSLLDEKKIGWQDKLFAKLQSLNQDVKKMSYVYFHDIIKTQNGDYYAIGELYRKTISAAGLAMAVLSKGQSGSVSQLTITDIVSYKFDKDFNLLDIKMFEKGKSRAPSITDFGSPQLNAHALAVYGAFDFINIQIDQNSDRFYANFIDYERLKGEKNKLAFVSVIHENGQLSTDKLYLKDERRHITRALPGKIGHVLVLDYNKKEKVISLHLEKLNIQ